MNCNKEHRDADLFVKDLPISQASYERHKCASCAYEKGLENGTKKDLTFNVEDFITNLPNSQKGDRRHRSAIEAYTLGFLHGLSGANNHRAIKEKLKIAFQMRDFGLSMVSKGLVDSIFNSNGNPYTLAMGLVYIVNGFEIIIKSKIVEQHPLLIFKKVPTDNNIKEDDIQIVDLLEHGETIMYSELPHRLWATTSCKIENVEEFKKFGNFRNQIIHFSIPSELQPEPIFSYTFKVIEKAVNDWWDTTLLDYIVDYDERIIQKVFEKLEQHEIPTNYKLVSNNSIRKN